ncbi:MAG: GNAT family N-acetyltransferase [Chloroflexota bacterium]|nr:GNAT family N-acetyltransferase [Chloroflexota bacterium]
MTTAKPNQKGDPARRTDIQEILALYDKELRIEVNYPGSKKEILPHVVRFIADPPGSHFILYSRLDETNADAVIQQQRVDFVHADLPVEWKVHSHDTPTDLRDRLIAQGFEADESEAVMVLDLHQVPPALFDPVAADIRRIECRQQLGDVIQIQEQVWQRDFGWINERLGSELDIPGYLHIYAAYVEEEPACAGWINFHPDSHFASLWGGSTVASYRGRGLYSALLAKRAQDAIERGYRFLVVDAGDMSRPILAKQGFQLLTVATPCMLKKSSHKER